jgi:hypothetical protein
MKKKVVIHEHRKHKVGESEFVKLLQQDLDQESWQERARTMCLVGFCSLSLQTLPTRYGEITQLN